MSNLYRVMTMFISNTATAVLIHFAGWTWERYFIKI